MLRVDIVTTTYYFSLGYEAPEVTNTLYIYIYVLLHGPLSPTVNDVKFASKYTLRKTHISQSCPKDGA